MPYLLKTLSIMSAYSRSFGKAIITFSKVVIFPEIKWFLIFLAIPSTSSSTLEQG
jgi:hypothetical protein